MPPSCHSVRAVSGYASLKGRAGTAEAEPFYKKALAIAENALDREKPLFAHILLSYAVVLERTSRKAQAKECRRRAKAILAAASTADARKFTVDLGDLRRKSSNRLTIY